MKELGKNLPFLA